MSLRPMTCPFASHEYVHTNFMTRPRPLGFPQGAMSDSHTLACWKKQRHAEPVTTERVLAALARIRMPRATTEYDVQRTIQQALDGDCIPYEKEYSLGPRNRIDFLIKPGIGIEVKNGTPTSSTVAAQLERYAAFPTITTLVLVVQRHVFNFPSMTTNGKPVHYVSLTRQLGISL